MSPLRRPIPLSKSLFSGPTSVLATPLDQNRGLRNKCETTPNLFPSMLVSTFCEEHLQKHSSYSETPANLLYTVRIYVYIYTDIFDTPPQPQGLILKPHTQPMGSCRCGLLDGLEDALSAVYLTQKEPRRGLGFRYLGYGVAVKELKLSRHDNETVSLFVYPHCGT